MGLKGSKWDWFPWICKEFKVKNIKKECKKIETDLSENLKGALDGKLNFQSQHGKTEKAKDQHGTNT